MIVVVGRQGQGQQMHREMFQQVVLLLDSLSLSDSHYWPPCQARASWLALAVQAFVEEVATVGPHVLHPQTLVGSLVKYNVASSSPTLQDSMPLPAIKKEGTPAISQISALLLSQAKLQLQKKLQNLPTWSQGKLLWQTPKPMSIFLSQTDLIISTIWLRRRSCIKSGVLKLHTVNRSKGSYTKIHCRDEHFNPPRCWMKWRSYTGKDFITLLVEPPPSQMV